MMNRLRVTSLMSYSLKNSAFQNKSIQLKTPECSWHSWLWPVNIIRVSFTVKTCCPSFRTIRKDTYSLLSTAPALTNTHEGRSKTMLAYRKFKSAHSCSAEWPFELKAEQSRTETTQSKTPCYLSEDCIKKVSMNNHWWFLHNTTEDWLLCQVISLLYISRVKSPLCLNWH